MDYERPRTATCAHCGRTFRVGPIGRVPLYCKPSCRVTAFDKRHRATKPSADERQRLMLWRMLIDLKVIAADTPLPPKPEGER